MKSSPLRQQGRVVEALLILLKQLTAHARWVMLLLFVLYAITGIRTVGPNEQVLVLRFGNLQPQVHGPGLLLGLPDPFDRVLRFETGKETAIALDDWKLTGAKLGDLVRPVLPPPVTREASNPLGIPIQYEDAPAAEPAPVVLGEGTLDPEKHAYTLTHDYHVIQGRFVLRYRIADPFRYTVAGERTGNLLRCLAYQTLTAKLAVRPIDESLTSDRRDVAEQAAAQVQAEAERLSLGVRISGLDIIELSPPSQVLPAFEEVVNARQFAKTLYENSRQYEAEALAKTAGETAAIVQKAEGEASVLVAEAQGEAAAFTSMLARYRLDPVLVSSRLLSETLDTVMQRTSSRSLVPLEQVLPSLMLEPLPAEGAATPSDGH